MVGVVIVTHGPLAQALLHTAGMILGPLEGVTAIGLTESESEEQMLARVEAATVAADEGQGVLVLVDMFGGSPSNISLRLMGERRLEVVTGANLPMLLKVAGSRELSLEELAIAAREGGVRHVLRAAELFKGR